MSNRVSPARIQAASKSIDPVFRNTPLIWNDELDRQTGANIMVKVETVNPIRCFKGRGCDLFVQGLPPDSQSIIAASAGNFGQGLAYAARKASRRLTVFVPENSNPIKVSAMRRMGAEVHETGRDMDEAKDAARTLALKRSPFC